MGRLHPMKVEKFKQQVCLNTGSSHLCPEGSRSSTRELFLRTIWDGFIPRHMVETGGRAGHEKHSQ